MQTSIEKRTIYRRFRLFVFTGFVSITSIGTASAQLAAPAPTNQFQSNYRIVTGSRPVTSNGEINTRDPYHLPESYNYDWPYGEGLSH